MFGTPWKKSTAILTINVNIDRLRNYRCVGAGRGICKRSGCHHLNLKGKAPDCRFWTKIAQPYPKSFCTTLARCYRDADLITVADNYSAIVLPDG